MARGDTAARWGWMALWLLLGCDPGAHRLVVDLRTDLRAPNELDTIQVFLDGEEVETLVADSEIDYFAGAQLVSLPDVPAGPHRVEVSLLRGTEVVVSRPVSVELDRDLVVTALITRDCRGVMCPADGGSPTETACLAGRCVEDACTPETP